LPVGFAALRMGGNQQLLNKFLKIGDLGFQSRDPLLHRWTFAAHPGGDFRSKTHGGSAMKPWNILGWILVAFIGICILAALINPRDSVTCQSDGYSATCVRS